MSSRPPIPGYAPVWQVWTMTTATAPPPTDETQRQVAVAQQEEMRERVQRARIARRLSIPALAKEVLCDPETIASFERGEEILPPDTRHRVLRHLELT